MKAGLMEALAGVGVIAGSLAIGLYQGRRRVLVVMLSFAVSCGVVALAALAPTNMFWLAVVWWFVSGFSFSTGNAPMTALLQSIIPNEIQGRVFSLMNTVSALAAPIGLAVRGPFGEAIGVRGVFVLCGALSGLLCLSAMFIPSIRDLDKGIPPRGQNRFLHS